MKIEIGETFTKSLNNLIDSTKWWAWEYWVDKYYETKWSLWALLKYFRVVIKMRPWDYGYILQMQRFQMDILMKNIDNGYEEDTSRGLKVKQMKRWIELCDNHIKDDYAERCGYIFDQKFEFEEIVEDDPNKEKKFRLKIVGGTQTGEERSECIRKSVKLADSEWNEMNDIIKGTGVVNMDETGEYDMGDGTDARGYWN